jgi:hypothetical protein
VPAAARIGEEEVAVRCHTPVVLCLSSVERRWSPFETEKSATMTEYLQVWRAKVADDAVDRLLAVRPEAIAEAQRLCPRLLRADLVRLGDGTWLDVLTWSCADGEERLMARAEEFEALHSMHELLGDAEAIGRGEIVPASR